MPISSLSLAALFFVASTALPLSSSLGIVDHQATICSSGVHIIHARGSTQTYEVSSINPLVNSIMAAVPNSSAEQVQYLAYLIADDTFYSTSVCAGVIDTIDKIERYVDSCGDSSRIVLLGYRQGGNVVTSALAGGLVKWLPLSPEYRKHSEFAFPSPDLKIRLIFWYRVFAVTSFGDPTHTKEAGYSYRSAEGSGIFKRLWPSTALLNTYLMRSYCLEDDLFCDNGFSLQAHSAEMETYGPVAADWIIDLAT